MFENIVVVNFRRTSISPREMMSLLAGLKSRLLIIARQGWGVK